MDLQKFFRACKIGDLDSARKLVETKDVDVNFRDKFDSTPLYYACLCGHYDLVQFLLENGAKCDVKTFDGERCVYGALTDEIRKLLLKEYNVLSKKIIRRSDFDEFLRKTLEHERYYDVVFNVHNIPFKAHRFILMARSEYFYDLLVGKWHDRTVIQIKNDLVCPDAFRILLHYLYTGIMEFSYRLKDDVLRLIKHCRLFLIYQMIESRLIEIEKGKCKKQNITIFIECPVSRDFYKLYCSTLPSHVSDLDEDLTNQDRLCLDQLQETSDVIFKVQNRLFRCHKMFFAGRSDYFLSLMRDHFLESYQMNNEIPLYEIGQISPDLFAAMTQFLYTDSVDLTLEQACKLLYFADVYLINGLKKHCSSIIANNIDQFNLVDIIQTARMLDLPKLESTATRHIAANLDKYLSQEDFRKLVIEDAKSVKERQETDTIDIIDDLRYYLWTLSGKSKIDLPNSLRKIDQLLESLGLEA